MKKVVVALVVLLVLVGCAKPNPIVGDWIGFGNGNMYRLTFNDDGTVLGDGKWGTYKCDGGKLTFLWKIGTSETVPYRVSDDYMSFFPDAEDSIIFAKN